MSNKGVGDRPTSPTSPRTMPPPTPAENDGTQDVSYIPTLLFNLPYAPAPALSHAQETELKALYDHATPNAARDAESNWGHGWSVNDAYTVWRSAPLKLQVLEFHALTR